MLARGQICAQRHFLLTIHKTRIEGRSHWQSRRCQASTSSDALSTAVLEGLDAQQRAAVTADRNQHLFIYGRPGCGKTLVLASRAAYLARQASHGSFSPPAAYCLNLYRPLSQVLEQGVSPSDILLLSATSRDAREARERLAAWLGDASAGLRVQSLPELRGPRSFDPADAHPLEAASPREHLAALFQEKEPNADANERRVRYVLVDEPSTTGRPIEHQQLMALRLLSSPDPSAGGAVLTVAGDLGLFDYSYSAADFSLRSVRMVGFEDYYPPCGGAVARGLGTSHVAGAFTVSLDRRVSALHQRDAVVVAPATLRDGRRLELLPTSGGPREAAAAAARCVASLLGGYGDGGGSGGGGEGLVQPCDAVVLGRTRASLAAVGRALSAVGVPHATLGGGGDSGAGSGAAVGLLQFGAARGLRLRAALIVGLTPSAIPWENSERPGISVLAAPADDVVILGLLSGRYGDRSGGGGDGGGGGSAAPPVSIRSRNLATPVSLPEQTRLTAAALVDPRVSVGECEGSRRVEALGNIPKGTVVLVEHVICCSARRMGYAIQQDPALAAHLQPRAPPRASRVRGGDGGCDGGGGGGGSKASRRPSAAASRAKAVGNVFGGVGGAADGTELQGVGLRISMFNHSNAGPNVCPVHLHSAGSPVHNFMAVVAVRDVAAGEELTLNYGEGYFERLRPAAAYSPICLTAAFRALRSRRAEEEALYQAYADEQVRAAVVCERSPVVAEALRSYMASGRFEATAREQQAVLAASLRRSVAVGREAARRALDTERS